MEAEGVRDEVLANPSKRFFVSMLTRDIDLQDAILDLLDNCIDGVLRSNKEHGPADEARPYDGFHASLQITPDSFAIEDNCGGIPRDVAINKAFRMGRAPDDDEGLPTIGMYGIGMKRAIFKMGEDCVVESSHGNDHFQVHISPEWMHDPNDWKLPIDDIGETDLHSGTRITITDLRPDILLSFGDRSSAFLNDLKRTISQFYSLIISKGFAVSVNDEEITPVEFKILTAPAEELGRDAANALAPYYIREEIDGVDIELWCGIYRPIPTDEEIDNETESRASRDDAGWTIVCNDRVVVYRDKTRLTGWGDSNVPNYHSQFIGITGIVTMTAARAELLPLTTTKRGIDGTSEIFLITREQMQEAIRPFITFTNRWKKSGEERERLYRGANVTSLADLQVMASNLPTKRERDGTTKLVPKLPMPATARDVRITFLRPPHEVREVARYLFENGDGVPNAEVGREAFAAVLKMARSEEA